MSELFNPHCDTVYFSKNNSEGLNDLNTAIDALYAIEAGALSARTLNTPIFVENAIRQLGIDAAGWAEKLRAMRSLLFGDDLNWGYVQKQLTEIPDKSEYKEG